MSAPAIDLCRALLDAPPGPARVALVARSILASKPVQHPLFTELAEVSIQAETEVFREELAKLQAGEVKKRLFAFKAGMLLITKAEKTAISIGPQKFRKINGLRRFHANSR